MGAGPDRILAASVHLCRAGLNSWDFGGENPTGIILELTGIIL